MDAKYMTFSKISPSRAYREVEEFLNILGPERVISVAHVNYYEVIVWYWDDQATEIQEYEEKRKQEGYPKKKYTSPNTVIIVAILTGIFVIGMSLFLIISAMAN